MRHEVGLDRLQGGRGPDARHLERDRIGESGIDQGGQPVAAVLRVAGNRKGIDHPIRYQIDGQVACGKPFAETLHVAGGKTGTGEEWMLGLAA